MVGTQIGSYRIDEKIGEGGMGTVYRATEVQLHRTVAIKVLNADVARNPALGERFRMEARSQANLNHTNIAILYAFLIHEGTALMVMEFVPGENFQQMILRRGAIPSQESIPLFKQALLGIGYAHRMGIVHRDIKPANLMLNSAGIVKVMDFGIAKAVGERGLTRTGTQVGTVQYMSPEQVKSEMVDTRSDIYALGITLYEMLSGRVPFIANSEFDVLTDHVKTAPPPPSRFHPSISSGLENIVLKALAKDPNDRFQTAEEFGSALEHPERWEVPVSSPVNPGLTRIEPVAVVGKTRYEGVVSESAPPPPPPSPALAQKRNAGLLVAMIASGVCLLGLVAFAATRFWPHPATPAPIVASVESHPAAPSTPTPQDSRIDMPAPIPPGGLETTPQPTPSEPAHNAPTRPAENRTKAAPAPVSAPSESSVPPPPPPPPPLAPMPLSLSASQEIVVRLTTGIDADATQTGLIYSASVNTAISIDGRSAIPAGAAAEVEVAKFVKPGRLKGAGKLDLALKSITVKGRKYKIASDEVEISGSSRAKKGGRFGVIGAVAGGVAHGVKGAVSGGGSGAASGAASGNSEMDLAPESLLTFHLTAPLTLSER